MINIQEKEKKIISFLEINGPSLPIQIAKTIEMDIIFASAITSELVNSKQIKVSHIKIGASPLYFLPGQEQKLEEYTDDLKSVEKNAFLKLKENKIIIDEEEEPAIRVALRNIKDFAIPFKFQEKILWKYAFTSDEEIKKLLPPPKETSITKYKIDNHKESIPQNYFIYKFTGKDKNEIYKNIEKLEKEYGKGFVYDRDLKEEEESHENKIRKFKKKIKEFSKTNPKMKFVIDYNYGLGRLMKMELEEAKKYGFQIIELNKNHNEKDTSKEIPKAWEIKKDPSASHNLKHVKPQEIIQSKKESDKIENIFTPSEDKNEKPEPEFLIEIKNFLKQKNIKFLEEVRTEKKEIMATISITSQLDNINFLLIAKNKKTITKDEIEAATQIATRNKMPCLLITRKQPSKSLQKLIDENHLIKIEIIK